MTEIENRYRLHANKKERGKKNYGKKMFIKQF